MTKNLTRFLKLAFVMGCFNLFFSHYAEAQERTDPSKDSLSSVPGDQSEMIPVLYGPRQKRYITSAVSSFSGDVVRNVPGTNRLLSLSGRLPGLTIAQGDGLPGAENVTYKVRGGHSFVNDFPWVIINGRQDDVSMIEPNDIETVTILKDAAATALYGMNASNGIILITTKRGKEGKVKVNYNVESSFQQPTRLPKLLDSYNYALLYNEALSNDNPSAAPKYDATALDAYRTGSDPYLYPNVNWTDELLKNHSLQVRNNVNISGGSADAKYYFSGSYLTDNGIFKTNKSINTYSTNTNLDLLNVRANIDLKVAKNLTLFADIRSKREKRNAPGVYSTNYDENILGALYGTPSNAHPILNPNGSLGGTDPYRSNPYGMLNYNGYSNVIIASVSSFSELVYDFNSLVKGLSLKGRFGFTSNSGFFVNRTKTFEVYQLNSPVTSPATYSKFGANSPMAQGGGYVYRNRIFDHSLALNHNANFGDHNISSMLMYERQQFDDGINGQPRLTKNFQGPKGSLSYRFKDRYLLDFVASYMGSEQYPKGDRYGFFPAVSAGWIISDESFMKGSNAIDFLKIRGSYGRTGNVSNSLNFNYYGSYTVAPAGVIGGGVFGTTPTGTAGAYLSQIANPLVTWEKSLKSNIGLDMALLNNKFNASFDYFNEDVKDILITNAITAMYGANILVPGGSFKNSGFEFQAGWANQIRDFQYSITANYSFAKNKIIEMGEIYRDHPYMYQTGNPVGTRMGYVFDRFFTETDDLTSLPKQSLLGSQKPGDLKYKDLNGDNIINDNDKTVIGNAPLPQRTFGVNLGGKYKAFDLNIFFHGTGGGTTYNSGFTYNEFANSGRGNVLEHHLNRWTPGSGQSAEYPRLTLSNQNNFVPSSYWVKDNSFVRLKYTELGYTLPTKLVGKIGMAGSRIFINGENLFLWDKVDVKDPEGQDNASGYPIMRSFSIGLNAKF